MTLSCPAAVAGALLLVAAATGVGSGPAATTVELDVAGGVVWRTAVGEGGYRIERLDAGTLRRIGRPLRVRCCGQVAADADGAWVTSGPALLRLDHRHQV